jgi:hypothetical protein
VGTLGLLCGLSSFFTMSACTPISVAVSVVSTTSSAVRESCVRPRIWNYGQAGFPSLRYMLCRSGSWQKQCAPKPSRVTRVMASQEGIVQISYEYVMSRHCIALSVFSL